MNVTLYGDTTLADVVEFRRALEGQCRALGIQLTVTSVPPTERSDLTIVFALAPTPWTADDEQRLKEIVGRSEPVLPVIAKPEDAGLLPGAIATINAFKKSDIGTKWTASLVDEVLSIAWLPRRTRKVFLSYRRIDSAPIANQLFGRFNELGYEVFLDDASIPRGVEFQRELKWWLNDADLLLLLLSPQFSSSRWCLEEISFAQNRAIGIAAIEWPAEVYEPAPSVSFAKQLGWSRPVVIDGTMEDQRYQLRLTDFVGVDPDAPPGTDPELTSRELNSAAVEGILALCAKNRAAAIRSRLDNLVPLVQATLLAGGAKDLTQTLGDLTYRDAGGNSCFMRVLPFRPRPEQLYATYQAAGDTVLATCAYAESDLQDTRARALRWLAEKRTSGPPPKLPDNTLWAFCGDKLL